MGLSSFTKDELQELEAYGLSPRGVRFAEALLAKKQVVMLEEMKARGRHGHNLEAQLTEEQARIMRGRRLLALRIKPFFVAGLKSTYVRATWRRSDGTVVREVL